MDESIKQYLKEHLTINISEQCYGFSGKVLIFELKVDDEVISDSSYILEWDKD